MARNTNPWVLHSQYLAVRALAMGLTSVNADASMAAARGVGRVVCMLDRRHRMRAFYNLRRSLAGVSPRIIDELVVGSFEHLIQLAMEVCHTPRIIHPHAWTQRVQLTDMGPAIAQLSSGKPALLVTGHMGNWEILGYLLATLGLRFTPSPVRWTTRSSMTGF
ncbi:MAG: hypothetical protein HC898_06650 [Phycisphaerales bacterium]|nr:hypothetical protein [Phycisphaerales bacterium]